MVACHYSDGSTYIGDSADSCPAFRDDTGGQLIGVEPVLQEPTVLKVDAYAPTWPVSPWWILLAAAFVYSKVRK